MKNSILPLLFLIASFNVYSQKLQTPSFSFSSKKTSYITLEDDTEIQGKIKDIDRKKGLIEYIELEDDSGNLHKLLPEQIKFMYLMPSGFDKVQNAMSLVNDTGKWNNQSLNDDFLNQGYVYFQQAHVQVKKKNQKLLMQLLNPNFSKFVKVYHDPRANSEKGLGAIGSSFKLDGTGDLKSYYISIDNAISFKLEKKDYKKLFLSLWGKCSSMTTQFEKYKWNDLTDHILAYSDCLE